jgi:hypothetical protein
VLALRPERRSGFRSIPPSTPSSTWAARRAFVFLTVYFSAGSGRELQFGIRNSKIFQKISAMGRQRVSLHLPSTITVKRCFLYFGASDTVDASPRRLPFHFDT